MAKKKTLALRAFRSDIIFQFEDETAILNDGRKSARGFKEITNWGFEYTNSKDSASNARWGIVKVVGPDVGDDIFVGRRVLIENLKWSEAVKFEGEEYHRTEEDRILAVDTSEDIQGTAGV